MDDGVTLRPPPVCTGRGVGLRTEWEPPTLRAALWLSTRRSWRLLDGFLRLQRRANASALPLTTCDSEREGTEVRESCILSSPEERLRSLGRRCLVRRESIPSRSSRVVQIGCSCSILSVDCRWNDISADSRPRGLWASMWHILGGNGAFPPDSESVVQARARNNDAWSFLIFQVFLLFPRQTADVYLEVRLRRGWLQYRSREFFAPDRMHGDCPNLRILCTTDARTHAFQSNNVVWRQQHWALDLSGVQFVFRNKSVV